MPLIRCSEQKRQTLEEFYTEFIPDKVNKFADGGTPMLKILELINTTFTQTVIYGLTSHATLLLLTENSSLSRWYVALNGLENEYYIEYLMTKEKQPWVDERNQPATSPQIEKFRSFDNLHLFHKNLLPKDRREIHKSVRRMAFPYLIPVLLILENPARV